MRSGIDLRPSPWSGNDDADDDASVKDKVYRYARKNEKRKHKHQNVEMLELHDNTELVRRLYRMTPFDLVECVK